MHTGLEISAVLPVFNEASVLETVVRELDRALDHYAARHEIIVVDDGSDDATPVIAESLERSMECLTVIRHDRNRGYGAALRSGFEAAGLEWVFFMDADGQFDPDDLRLLMGPAATADLVAGFRVVRHDPWTRRVAAQAFGRLFVPALLGVRARDLNCAFKLVRRALLARCNLGAEGAGINAELVLKLQHLGARIVEVGVTHRPRRAGRATGGRLAVILKGLREVWRLRGLVRDTNRCTDAPGANTSERPPGRED